MLDQDVKVNVSIEDKPNKNESTPKCATKHFANGFHEGRWEDDIYTHDGDGKPYIRDIHGNEYDPTKMNDGQSDFSEDDLIV